MPPENMLRCMTNNYSLLGFWRQWHSSFNQWITRYMYIPMGGTRNLVWNVWPVFTFVALWHDMNFNLLAWGWLNLCLHCTRTVGDKICSTKMSSFVLLQAFESHGSLPQHSLHDDSEFSWICCWCGWCKVDA